MRSVVLSTGELKNCLNVSKKQNQKPARVKSHTKSSNSISLEFGYSLELIQENYHMKRIRYGNHQ